MKTNYILPAIEYFSQGLEDVNFSANNRTSNLFGIVLYKTAQSMPNAACSTFGPFISLEKLIKTIDNLDLTGGKSESNANLSEGLATALVCFQDLENLREGDVAQTSKHCILISNSSPYSMPVSECAEYQNKTVEQLATIFQDKNINLSIISPRKIPVLFDIYEKSGGDFSSSKNYSKDPRHLVLLKGFQLKERPLSPMNTNPQPSPMPVQTNIPNQQQQQQQQQQQMQQIVDPLMLPNANQAMRQGVPPMNQQQIRPQMVQPQIPNQPTMPGLQQQGAMNPGQFNPANPMNNYPQRPVNPPQRWIMPNQRQPFMAGAGNMQNIQGGMMPGAGNVPVQNNMIPNQQQQGGQPQPQHNSALISQLSTPPNIGTLTPQQQQYRMMQNQQQMMQNQQQQQQLQQQNPNIMGTNNPNQIQNQMPQQMQMQQQQAQGVQGNINNMQQPGQNPIQQQQPGGMQQPSKESFKLSSPSQDLYLCFIFRSTTATNGWNGTT